LGPADYTVTNCHPISMKSGCQRERTAVAMRGAGYLPDVPSSRFSDFPQIQVGDRVERLIENHAILDCASPHYSLANVATLFQDATRGCVTYEGHRKDADETQLFEAVPGCCRKGPGHYTPPPECASEPVSDLG